MLSAKMSVTKCYACTGTGSTAACTVASGFTGTPKTIYDCPGYRLPAEAEWERAYRANTATAYHNGPNDALRCDDCDNPDANLDKIAWYCHNSNNTIHKVGTKAPNTWGLYDMAGNVLEWCHDGFQADLGATAALNPLGPEAATARVTRGAGYYLPPKWLRAANRGKYTGAQAAYAIGFRTARSLLP
jgi:formylglycine-generating enzyme required for sulfatase activity